MDDVQRPFNTDAHAYDTTILVDNNVIENVVANVTAGVLEDIWIPICKQASIVPYPPSPTI